MTVQYAIVAFPELDARDEIERIRRQYDPLAAVLDAHVTLVFPFEDTLSSADMRGHVLAATEGVAPFEIALGTPTSADDGYLLLNVLGGREVVVEVHRRLYSGRLHRHLSQAHTYDPHVTIGRLATPEQLGLASNEARARLVPPIRGHIRSVAVFRLDGAHGTVESIIALSSPRLDDDLGTLETTFPN